MAEAIEVLRREGAGIDPSDIPSVIDPDPASNLPQWEHVLRRAREQGERRRLLRRVHVIWGASSHEKMFDPRVARPPYASNIVKFGPLPCGHYPAEQAPEDTYRELHEVFGS